MRYPLEGLMAVKAFREERSVKNLGAAETRLKAATAETEKQRRRLEDFLVWCAEEAERRYQAIMGREMSQGELEEFKYGLAALDSQALERHEAAAEAEKLEAAARASLQEAKAALREAALAREKISLHREIWLESAACEEERLQDLELEEFKPVLFE
jgi:type III secretion protein O